MSQNKTKLIFKRYGGKCFYCCKKVKINKKGQSICDHDSVTTDYLIPTCHDGKDENHNKVLSCFDCNNKKSRNTSFEFLGLKYMRYMFAEAARKTLYVPEYTKEIPFD